MKNFILKSIIIMMVAFASIEAGAQSVITVTTETTTDAQECRKLLQEHPTDTIRSRFETPILMNDTSTTVVDGVFFINGVTPPMAVLGYSVFLRNDSLFRVVDCEKRVEVVDTVLAERLFGSWLERNCVDSLLSGHPRDYEWIAEKAIPETAADMAMRELHDYMFVHYRMDTLGVASPRDIRYPKWGRDKYGPYLFADFVWQNCEGRNGATGDLGFGYDTQNGYWKAEVKIGYGRSDYSTNAVHESDPYWVFRTAVTLGVRPVKVDANDLNRLFIIGGVGYERYRTDSKPSDDGSVYQSRSNYVFPHAGLRYERRFPKWGITFYLSGEWRTFQYVIQDQGRTGGNGTEWSSGLIWTICRHLFKTTSIR